MLLFIYIGLIALGLVIKNSRIFDGVVIVFLCFIVATSTTQADYLNYKSAYDFLGASHVFVQLEPGWQLLCLIGHYAGLSYEAFVAAIIFLALLLLVKCMVDFGCNRSLFWSLFLIFPALIFLVQFRQFISLPIVLFALRFLARREPGDSIRFCAFILVASLIHSINIVYLLFLMPLVLKKSKLLLGVMVVFGLVTLAAAPNLVQEVARYLFSDVKVDYYFSGQGEHESCSHAGNHWIEPRFYAPFQECSRSNLHARNRCDCTSS